MKLYLKGQREKQIEEDESTPRLVVAGSEEDNEQYKMVRDYVYDHQGASAAEVSLATGVATSVILRYLKEGKIHLAENQKTLLSTCKMCSVVIDRGTLCKACREKRDQKTKAGFAKVSSDHRRRSRR